jgi:hypothetical protein
MGTLAVDNIQHTDGSSAVTLNNATITTGSIPAAGVTGTLGSGVIFPAGHVIQTKTVGTNTLTYFGDGTAYDVMTDFAITITPEFSNSKIIITFHSGIMIYNAPSNIMMKVTGTTTGEVKRQNQWGHSGISGWHSMPLAVIAVDTPGVTDPQTYQLYLGTQTSLTDSYARLNSEANTNAGTITAMEIKV